MTFGVINFKYLSNPCCARHTSEKSQILIVIEKLEKNQNFKDNPQEGVNRIKFGIVPSEVSVLQNII